MKQECKYKKYLSSFLDGELSQIESDKTRLHMETCENCRNDFESLKFTDELLSRIPAIEPSTAFERSFWNRVSDFEKKKHWFYARIFPFKWRPYLAATLTAVIIGAVIFFYYQPFSPIDEDEIIAEHIELFRDYEIINHLDLLENMDTIMMLKEKS